MKYTKQEGIRGAWLEKTMELNDKKAKLVSETKPVEGQYGNQDVAKIIVQGDKETKNVGLNKPTINGLIEAFGDDSNNWTNKVLTIRTEKMIVSGKRVIGFYLIPEGFELTEDAGGYLVITRIGKAEDKKEEKEEKVVEYPEDDINPDDIPF